MEDRCDGTREPIKARVDLAQVDERTAALLVAGGHVAEGDEIRAAVRSIEDRVRALVDSGRVGYPDHALAAIAVAATDRLATRLLQGREPGDALVEVAILHALDGHKLPAHWWDYQRRGGGESASAHVTSSPSGSSRVDRT